jgi:serine/threonine protein kinase/Flp pilus assembly protein TadD
VKTQAIPSSVDRSAELALLVEQLNARLEAGEPVDREEIERQYPEFATELRDLLPAMALLVNLSRSRSSALAIRDDDGAPLGELGDYRIVREVGRGGMGVVYEAEQISLGRSVALKMLPYAATMDPKQLQRFKNEAKAAASLRHEHIVHVYGVGCERGVHYYAMEFIDGQTLAQLIAGMRNAGESPAQATAAYVPAPLSSPAAKPGMADKTDTARVADLSTERSGPKGREFYRTAAGLIAQAADALEHAHGLGIVHRDVKPANLLVDAAGKLYVSDFGLARFGPDAGLTVSGDLLGTLRYMAPEQALARHGLVDHRADIYGMGATLYELLSGRPAVDAAERAVILRQIAFEDPTPPRRRDKSIPEELETITLKALAKNPNERYATAGELADDLRHWLDDKPIRARRPSLAQRARRWGRRHRTLAWAATAVLLTAGVMLAGSIGYVARDRTAQRQFMEQQAKGDLDEANRAQTAGRRAEALFAIKRAVVALVGARADDARLRPVRERLADLEMLETLETISLRKSTGRSDLEQQSGADADYVQAFRDYGIDVDGLSVNEAAARIREKSIRVELAAALDDWYITRRPNSEAGRDHLMAISRLADPDEWRNKVRDLFRVRPDAKAAKQLVDTIPVEQLPPLTAIMLTYYLNSERMCDLSATVLGQVQRLHPDDFWLNHDLGWSLMMMGPSHQEEALRYYTAALALRPHNPSIRMDYATALLNVGKVNEGTARGMAAFREGLRLRNNDVVAVTNFISALVRNGRLDDAITIVREQLQLAPGNMALRNRLYSLLAKKGSHDDAIADAQQVVRAMATNASAHNLLGHAFYRKGAFDDAITAYREAIRLSPDSFVLHFNLQLSLAKKGDREEALVEARKAIRNLRSDSAADHNRLAWLFATQLDPKFGDPAITVQLANRAVELDSKQRNHWGTLGVAHYRAGDWKSTITAMEEAINLSNGGVVSDFFFLAMAHWQLGDKDQGRQWYDQAVQWMDQHKPENEELDRFRAEAAELLGLPAGTKDAQPPPGDARL